MYQFYLHDTPEKGKLKGQKTDHGCQELWEAVGRIYLTQGNFEGNGTVLCSIMVADTHLCICQNPQNYTVAQSLNFNVCKLRNQPGYVGRTKCRL